MLLLGVDQAARVAALGLPRRAEVYLVAGEKTSAAQAQQWSMRLGAAVISLPASAGWLSDALADISGTGEGVGSLVCVVGGSGGVGASTLASGLAFVAARASHRTMLIDADARSGGLDLLLGAERTAGWRWPRLATARGHLGDLTGQLPSVEGVDLLSMARGESTPGWELQAEQLKSVLLSAMRSHEITVVDLPRTLGAAAWEALRRAKLAVLLVRDDVRGVAAGREVVRELEAGAIASDWWSGRADHVCWSRRLWLLASVCHCLGRSSMTRRWSSLRNEAIRRLDLRAALWPGSVASCSAICCQRT